MGELAASAAERRLRDDLWCSGTVFEAEKGDDADAVRPESTSAAKGGIADVPAALPDRTAAAPEPPCQPCSDGGVSTKRQRVSSFAVDLTADCRPGCRCCSTPSVRSRSIDWSCSVCTLRNPTTVSICTAC